MFQFDQARLTAGEVNANIDGKVEERKKEKNGKKKKTKKKKQSIISNNTASVSQTQMQRSLKYVISTLFDSN